MAVKKYKPVTPGQRNMTGYAFDEITKSKPERSLLVPLRKSGGRNAYGRVTVRHRGGGHRQFIRKVDFKREKRGITDGLLRFSAGLEHPDDLINDFSKALEKIAIAKGLSIAD